MTLGIIGPWQILILFAVIFSFCVLPNNCDFILCEEKQKKY